MSLSLDLLRSNEEYAGKSDSEIAKAIAEKEGYVVVFQFEDMGENLAPCSTAMEVNQILTNPNYSDAKILYDIRDQVLKITPELILQSKCDLCGRPSDQRSLIIGGGNDFYFCPTCGTMWCQSCYPRLPLTGYPIGSAKCPRCSIQLQRAFPGAYGKKPLQTPPQSASARPASSDKKPITQNQPTSKPAEITAATTPVSLPKNFKTVTHLVSVLGPGLFMALFIFIIVGISEPPFPSLLDSIFTITLLTLGYSTLNFLYYLLAGGLEWKNKKLPVIRIVLFYILGDVVIGLFFYIQWYLVRVIMAKVYGIPFPLAMGRLLATHQKTYPSSITETGKGDVCEKCGKQTSIGKFYRFICGEKIRSYTSSVTYNGRVVTTEYKTHESDPVYLCNKCVILKNQREVSKALRRATQVVFVLLVLFVLLYFALGIMNENNFLGWPIGLISLLIVVGSVTLVQWMRLAGREESPLQYYSNIHDNPDYYETGRTLLHSHMDSLMLDQGEKLAIKLKQRALAKSGVDAFFTHEEARTRLHSTR